MPRNRSVRLVKVTDATDTLRCAVGIGVIREETWADAAVTIVRYNLAFINHQLYPKDNGRVLGYDTAHGHVHRHFAGTTEAIEPAAYLEVFERFIAEIAILKTLEKL